MLELIFCLLIMWPVGYFMALCITGGLCKRWWSKLLQALLGLAIGGIILFALHYTAKEDARKYNNGICTECGGEYKFSGAAGRQGKSYYYSCTECDHTIRVESIQN